MNNKKKKSKCITIETKNLVILAVVAIVLIIVLIGVQLRLEEYDVLLKNPTFNEMTLFLACDRTDENDYINKEYECANYCIDVITNAIVAGWQCGFVLLCYEWEQHAMIVFDTVDKGLVFVEPQTDEIVDVQVGDIYSGKEILDILIVW